MPTTAWAIIPSAGERRGSVGIAGTSYSRRANAAASWTERCGRLPTPVAAPDRRLVAECRHGASGRDGGRCRPPCRQVLRPSSSRSSPSPTPFAGCSVSPRFLLALAPPPTGRTAPSEGDTFAARRPLSANLLAVPDSLPPPPAPGTGIWAQLTLWGARLAWLAGGRPRRRRGRRRRRRPQRRRAAVGHDRGVDGMGGRRPRPRRARRRDADRRAGRRPRQPSSPPASRSPAGARAAPRARPGRPGARRHRPRRRGRHRPGLRPGLGLRRRAALPAAPAVRLPRRDRRVVGGVGGRGRSPPRWPGRRASWVLAVVATVVAAGGDLAAAAPLAPAQPALAGGRPGRARRPRPGRARRDADAAPPPDRRPRPGRTRASRPARSTSPARRPGRRSRSRSARP